MNQRSKRQLSARRHGASHSLMILAQIPILILIIAAIIEVNSMMLTKVGLEYSAASVARSAIVHLQTEGSVEQRLERIRAAASVSFAPYSTGRDLHVKHLRESSATEELALALDEAHNLLSDGAVDNDLLKNKIRYSHDSIRIEIDVYDDFDPLSGKSQLKSSSDRITVTYVGRQRGKSIDEDNPDLDVRLFYEKPIDIPGVGVVLGRKANSLGANFYVKSFEAKCSATLEGVKSEDHRIGIKYDVFSR